MLQQSWALFTELLNLENVVAGRSRVTLGASSGRAKA